MSHAINVRPSKNHVYEVVHPVIPSNLHPLLAQELGLGQPNSTQPQTTSDSAIYSKPANPSIDYPFVLPASPFTFEEIATFNRSPILPDDIIQYRRDPDSLFGCTFFSSDSEDAGAFRVSAVMSTSDQGKLFYVVFADEGPQGICCSMEHFFGILSSSERVLTAD